MTEPKVRQKKLKLKQQKPKLELSQSELNVVLHQLGYASRVIQNRISALRVTRSELWNRCDKEKSDDPTVSNYFEGLNLVNDAIRIGTRRQKHLASVIRKLKSQR